LAFILLTCGRPPGEGGIRGEVSHPVEGRRGSEERKGEVSKGVCNEGGGRREEGGSREFGWAKFCRGRRKEKGGAADAPQAELRTLTQLR
jgi:hypothetical protein